MSAAGALHLYVHWPFCRTKCAYCDFNSETAGDVDAGRWQRALLRALAASAEAADETAEQTARRTLATIFFGGGTPSLMPPAMVGAIIDAAARRWRLAEDIEITIEANPTSADAGRFEAFRSAGVNRISIGVQSFEDAALRFLGRTHTAAEAVAAIAAAQTVFARVSFDLICGWPGQDSARWRRALDTAVSRAGEHLSVYELSIEPGTALARRRVAAVDEAHARALYEITQSVLGAAGLAAYEVSNHARPGAECRHNLGVWRGDDYLGIGPGAHGRLRTGSRTLATRQIRSPARWLRAVEGGGAGRARGEALSGRARAVELVLLGLRLAGGVRGARVRALTGVALTDVIAPGAVALLTGSGDLIEDGDALIATAQGRLRLDAVLAKLLA